MAEDIVNAENLSGILAINPSSITDFRKKFDIIANQLMNLHVMVINGNEYRLAELEFYLNDTNHPDIFTHDDKLQLTCGQWYFHRTGSTYKGGTYKGLDITFSTRGYGGILIRALKNVINGTYIEGPCNVVNTILKETNSVDIKDLVERSDFSNKVDQIGTIYIKSCKTTEHIDLNRSGRFGLVLRNNDQASYVLKPYRYILFPSSVRKGRQHLVLELYYNKNSVDNIASITGCTVTQIGKWIKPFDSVDLDTDPSLYFAKKLNTTEFSSFYNILRRKSDS